MTEYSLAHLTALDAAPPELVDLAADAGFDLIGLRLTPTTETERRHRLLEDPGVRRATLARLAARGIGVLDIEVARLRPDADRTLLRAMLDVGGELGARHVITQLYEPDPQRRVDLLGEFADLAAPTGIRPVFEFMPWMDVTDLHATAELLRAVGRPNVGILVDTLHFHRSRSSVAELAGLPREWFPMVHLADAPDPIPTDAESLIATARGERLRPGEGDIDLAAILAAMPSDTVRALEIPNVRRWAEEGLPGYAAQTLATTRAVLEPEEGKTS